MAINVPAQKSVNPGEPVTAEGWNALVGGISALTQYLNSTEASGVHVVVKNAGVNNARITASRVDGVTFQAVNPVPPGTDYIFAGLSPGVYSVRVEAAGFNAATASATVPAAAPIEFTLTASGGFMPNVFGLALHDALQQLSSAGIAVGRILDVVGRDVAPANPGSDYNNQPVLMQLPPAAWPVPAGSQSQLVVSAALQVQQSVEVPSLAGLSLNEAQKALESIGLVLGKVVTKA
ncbi:MAG: hypothetical protein ABI806_17220 [Candidatus Solibacter sp.]